MKNTRLYNIMLPIWMLVFWPSPLWLILIPANYLIDRLILGISLKGMEERGRFLRKNTWKVCLAGFLGDAAGAALLFSVFMVGAGAESDSSFGIIMEKITYGSGFNPFDNVAGFLTVLVAVMVSAIVIFFTDRAILKRAGLAVEQAKKSAMMLAVITAPYLYFIPSELMYGELVG